MKDNAVKGLKFQSTWQNCFVDDDRMLRIYEAIGEDMIVLLHAGGSRTKRTPHVKASLHRIAHILHLFRKLKIIAAHFAGNYMLEESRIHLVGRNIYLDTSAPPALEDRVDNETIMDIIKRHGQSAFWCRFPFVRQEERSGLSEGCPLAMKRKRVFCGKTQQNFFS